MASSSWTSVQIATLAVQALIPVTVALVGIFYSRANSRRLEQLQWANQLVVGRRLDIFTEVAPNLNKLLCFATFVGNWKDILPGDTIAIKRQLDQSMFATRVLFDPELYNAYNHFMSSIFAIYAPAGGDARLRVPIETAWGNRRTLPWWSEHMTTLFVPASETASADEVQDAYEKLADLFRSELYAPRPVRLPRSP